MPDSETERICLLLSPLEGHGCTVVVEADSRGTGTRLATHRIWHTYMQHQLSNVLLPSFIDQTTILHFLRATTLPGMVTIPPLLLEHCLDLGPFPCLIRSLMSVAAIFNRIHWGPHTSRFVCIHRHLRRINCDGCCKERLDCSSWTV